MYAITEASTVINIRGMFTLPIVCVQSGNLKPKNILYIFLMVTSTFSEARL